jgi:hypothetical protein
MSIELGNISAISVVLFGTIKTGNNVLVSENFGDITTKNFQPILIDIKNAVAGSDTTFFTKTNSTTYVRTATTLKYKNGNYAIDSTLDVSSPAYAALQNGLPYVGGVVLYDIPYFAYYIPVFEPGTTLVIGVYFLAIQLTSSEKVSPLDSSLSNIKLLKYFTGSVNSSPFLPYLLTKNQGNLTTETFQPIVKSIDYIVNNNNTIFTRIGNEFIRTATTLTDVSGNYAIGTLLSNESPAYQPLLNGKSYSGIVQLYGFNFYASYEPIFDSFTGFVIGAYFSGAIL